MPRYRTVLSIFVVTKQKLNHARVTAQQNVAFFAPRTRDHPRNKVTRDRALLFLPNPMERRQLDQLDTTSRSVWTARFLRKGWRPDELWRR